MIQRTTTPLRALRTTRTPARSFSSTLLRPSRQRPQHHGPTDLPPISARLRPLLPFFFWWTVVTSLIVHRLQIRKSGEAARERCAGQESALLRLVERFEAGEVVPDAEIRKELEMVGLRERKLTVDEGEGLMREVSWLEVLRGRGAGKEENVEGEKDKDGEEAAVESTAESEAKAADEWAKIVKEATTEPAKAAPAPAAPEAPTGVVRRASSSKAYI